MLTCRSWWRQMQESAGLNNAMTSLSFFSSSFTQNGKAHNRPEWNAHFTSFWVQNHMSCGTVYVLCRWGRAHNFFVHDSKGSWTCNSQPLLWYNKTNWHWWGGHQTVRYNFSSDLLRLTDGCCLTITHMYRIPLESSSEYRLLWIRETDMIWFKITGDCLFVLNIGHDLVKKKAILK